MRLSAVVLVEQSLLCEPGVRGYDGTLTATLSAADSPER